MPLSKPSASRPARSSPSLTYLAGEFLGFLTTPLGLLYLALEFGFLGAGLLRWLRDGTPGLAPFRALLASDRPVRD